MQGRSKGSVRSGVLTEVESLMRCLRCHAWGVCLSCMSLSCVNLCLCVYLCLCLASIFLLGPPPDAWLAATCVPSPDAWLAATCVRRTAFHKGGRNQLGRCTQSACGRKGCAAAPGRAHGQDCVDPIAQEWHVGYDTRRRHAARSPSVHSKHFLVCAAFCLPVCQSFNSSVRLSGCMV